MLFHTLTHIFRIFLAEGGVLNVYGGGVGRVQQGHVLSVGNVHLQMCVLEVSLRYVKIPGSVNKEISGWEADHIYGATV